MSDPASLDELRRRLTEAEETLRAIREGEVDALVIGRSDQPRVFSIGGDAEAFRAFIEVMDTGAAAVDEAGRVLYANATFGALVGHADAPLHGVALADLLGAPAGPLLAGQSVEITRQGPDGASYLVVSGKPLQIGTVSGHAITLADVTERVRSERAAQTERTAQAILASANQAVMVCDADGIVTHANAASRKLYDGDPVGRPFAEVLPLVPEAEGLADGAAILARAVQEGGVQGVEVFAPGAAGAQHFLLSAAPLMLSEADGCVVTLVDLSQRKLAERQQLLLMNELDHRVKNSLAMVLAISRRTLRQSPDLPTFEKTFAQRVQALAATHNLLARHAWKGLSVQDVVVAELSPFMELGDSRVETTGLEQLISAEAAIALGMVLHELATNAVKYGALSTEVGRIIIRALRDDPGDRMVIEWRERDGPAVVRPLRGGFGETVITQSLLFARGGEARLDYDPEGIVCTLAIPCDHLRA